MNTKTNLVAAAVVLSTLAIPGIASAQAMFLPSSYASSQTETSNIPADARGSVVAPAVRREPHTVTPYGQW
jgi:hypothetical protein